MTLVLKDEGWNGGNTRGKIQHEQWSRVGNTGKETKKRGKLKMTPNFCPCVIRQMVKL